MLNLPNHSKILFNNILHIWNQNSFCSENVSRWSSNLSPQSIDWAIWAFLSIKTKHLNNKITKENLMEIYQSYSKNTKNVPYFQVHRTVQKFKTHNTESLNKVQNSRNGNTLVWSQNVKKTMKHKAVRKRKTQHHWQMSCF